MEKNKNNDTFVVRIEKNLDDIDIGIGYITFLNRTGKYNDNICLKCLCAV